MKKEEQQIPVGMPSRSEMARMLALGNSGGRPAKKRYCSACGITFPTTRLYRDHLKGKPEERKCGN